MPQMEVSLTTYVRSTRRGLCSNGDLNATIREERLTPGNLQPPLFYYSQHDER